MFPSHALGIEPHRQAGAHHVILGLADGEFPEVEDRRGQHTGGVTLADAIDEMIEIADAAGRDDAPEE